MAIHLTPEILVNAYELLRVTPPFRGWKLPHSDDIVFIVSRHRDRYADTDYDNGKFILRVSQRKQKQLGTVLATVAHEMIHIRQGLTGAWHKADHGKTFQTAADVVCRYHGFDRGAF